MTGEKKIQGLIDEIKNQQLILPEFQRGYVWKRPAVRSFLTSLYRGYPTGSFLIWKTPEPGKVRGPQDLDVKGHRFLPSGGHENPHWRPRFLPTRGHGSPRLSFRSHQRSEGRRPKRS